MQEERRFFRTVCILAIPAALQSLLQLSFSLVDQIMIGQLGAVSVAAVGLAVCHVIGGYDYHIGVHGDKLLV